LAHRRNIWRKGMTVQHEGDILKTNGKMGQIVPMNNLEDLKKQGRRQAVCNNG